MNIKIFVSYHDKHKIIKSDIITPIQTGCANAPELFKGMLRDDDGENISDKNDRYNELSAQYWVWKNYKKIGNPDYVGFMHYRRHFIFDDWIGIENHTWLPGSSVYFVPFIHNKYLQHISDKSIVDCIKNTDCIVIKQYDVKNLGVQTCRDQYLNLEGQRPEWFDIFVKTALKLYPEYKDEIKIIKDGSMQYLCNMFVMKRDLFNEYSEFCFKILDAVDKQIDSSNLNTKESRFLGYFGEFLLSIFVFHLYKHKKVCIKELNAAYIRDESITWKKRLKCVRYFVASKILIGRLRRKYKEKYICLKWYINGGV